MSKIRIAQIGTSRYSHGNFIFDALKKSPDIFEIAGYAMPEGEETKFPENMAPTKEKNAPLNMTPSIPIFNIPAFSAKTSPKPA